MFDPISVIGFFSILIGNCALFLFVKPIQGLVALLCNSIGFVLLSIRWFDGPLPLVLGIAFLVSLILLWVPQSPLFFSADRVIPSVLSPAFRVFYIFFSLSLVIVFYPIVGTLLQNPPPTLLLPTFFTFIVCLLSIGLSEHPLRVGLNLISLAQGFSMLFFWMQYSLFAAGLYSLILIALSLSFSFFCSSPSLLGKETTK